MVAKLLGLGYPGGPIIEKLAQDGNPEAIDFPRAYLPETFDFSFSGIKTAVLNYVKTISLHSELRTPNSELKNDIAASFQASVIDVLVKKTEWAIRKERIERVILTGGVAANNELRKRMKEMCDERGSG